MNLYYTVLLSLFTLCLLSGQTTFRTVQDFHPGEPNVAYKVVEHDGEYYLGGNYFDDEIGRWTAFYSIYDNEGNHLKLLTEKMDTVPDNLISKKILKDSIGLYYLGFDSGFTTLYHYNFRADSTWVSHKIDQVPIDFSPHDVTLFKGNFIFCGRDWLSSGNRHVSLISVSSDDSDVLKVFHDEPNFLYSERSLSISSNSKEELVVHAKRSIPQQEPISFIMFFDKELNLLHSTKNTSDELPYNTRSGFCIDSDDNIIIPGVEKVGADFFQLVSKLDPFGKEIWKKQIDFNHNNNFQGRWSKIVEAHEKDGYIIAGSEHYQNDIVGADTSITIAAVAKISLEGDLIWYRTYSHRTGYRVADQFNDIQPTTDGGYILVGESATFVIPEEEELSWLQALIIKTDANGQLGASNVSIMHIDPLAGVTLSPNPVSDRLYITQSTDKKLSIKIYNASSQLVDSFNSIGSEHTTILDVSYYQAGNYTLLVQDEKGGQTAAMFVKI